MFLVPRIIRFLAFIFYFSCQTLVSQNNENGSSKLSVRVHVLHLLISRKSSSESETVVWISQHYIVSSTHSRTNDSSMRWLSLENVSYSHVSVVMQLRVMLSLSPSVRTVVQYMINILASLLHIRWWRPSRESRVAMRVSSDNYISKIPNNLLGIFDIKSC